MKQILQILKFKTITTVFISTLYAHTDRKRQVRNKVLPYPFFMCEKFPTSHNAERKVGVSIALKSSDRDFFIQLFKIRLNFSVFLELNCCYNNQYLK